MSESQLELQLIVRAASGEHYAYEQLVIRYQALVYSVLLNLCRHRSLADDLLQMTFLKAWEKLNTYRNGSFRSWLCKIAVREYLMHQRKHARENKLTEALDLGDENSETKRDATESSLDLQKALGLLRHEDAQLIVMHIQIGFTHSEIATLMNMPLGTVKSKVRRGLNLIQNTWESNSHE
ncbi:RNA polymerase sigma factor [Ningiella sp. W23]|uniref:RNA polymerase sigma factor n=1 Tax=Ningiella sp. W23 TaxID=3023715 RepID=UPI003757FB99